MPFGDDRTLYRLMSRKPAEPIASSALSSLPAPPHATLVAAAVYVVATFLLAWPALGGSFLVAPHSDQFIAGYAFREYAAASLRAGEGFPQWNSYLFGGMPYIAAMHGDIFYPTFLLRMLLPTDIAMTWGFVIHLFLAGFLTYGFLRAWGLGFYGALLGGVAYMLSGPIAGYASPGHDGKLFVSALLPLSLWMLVRLVRDGKAWALGAFALVVGLAFLSPHPQLFQYLLLASGSFTLYLAFHTPPGGTRLPRLLAIKRIATALGGVGLGVIMGAVQYVPALFQYEKWSPRSGGAGWDHAVSYSMPMEELFNAIVPEFSGILNDYWGRNMIHFHSEYAGAVVLVLAGAGMFASGLKSFRWFWIGTLVVSLLWALGGSTPFYRLVYELVPYTKYLRAPSTMMFMSMFSLAVLAGLGTERILTARARPSNAFFFGWAAAIVVLGALFATGLPLNVAQSIADQMSGVYPPETVARVINDARANQGAVVVGSLRSIAFVLLTLALVWVTTSDRFPRRQAAWILVALVAVDFWITERRYWIFSPRAEIAFASDPALDTVKKSAEPGRVLTWNPFPGPRDVAFYDGPMVQRIRIANGYHGNEIGRYQQLFQGESAQSPVRMPLSMPFLRHANIRYLYTTVPDTMISQFTLPLGWSAPATKIMGPIRNAAGSMVYLYRLPGDNPAAWVASAIVKGTDEQALATVLDPRFDQTRAAIVDTGAKVQGVQPTTAPPPSGVQTRVTRFEPGSIDVQLDKPAPAGSALVVSENFYPGWSAAADGKPASVARTNFNLIGVELPAGAKEVRLRFADADYATGKVVTLAAIVVALVLLIGGVVMERRRPAVVAA